MTCLAHIRVGIQAHGLPASAPITPCWLTKAHRYTHPLSSKRTAAAIVLAQALCSFRSHRFESSPVLALGQKKSSYLPRLANPGETKLRHSFHPDHPGNNGRDAQTIWQDGRRSGGSGHHAHCRCSLLDMTCSADRQKGMQPRSTSPVFEATCGQVRIVPHALGTFSPSAVSISGPSGSVKEGMCSLGVQRHHDVGERLDILQSWTPSQPPV